MDQDLLDDLDSALTYGDSRSEFVRDAVRLKLAVDDALGNIGEMSAGEQRQLVVDAVEAMAEGDDDARA